MNLLREYIREQLLLERAEASLFSGVGDFIASRRYDDVMDSVFKRIAPNLVRHVMEQEINEDMAEFLDGAIEGRWEKQRDWAGEDPSPEQHGHSKDSADYALGYTWGWNNAGTWKGDQLPSQARKEAVESQIKEFEDQISEQMVIAALEEANERINPVKLLKKAVGAIRSAVQEEGLAGGLKKGLPIAIGIIVGEALDNFIIPMAFFSMTGIPIPPLPIGVGEIINPVVISMVGADMETEELADELGWYEGEYGEASSLGPRETNELREYIRDLLIEQLQAQEITYDRRDRPEPTTGVTAFMGEYKSLTKHNPIGFPGDRYWYMGEIDGKYCLVITNVKVDPFHGNSIHFNSIQTVPPDTCEGQGFASKIMKKITDLADKHQVALRLDAVPFGQESVTEEDLVGWYTRAGFIQVDPDYSESMVREPK